MNKYLEELANINNPFKLVKGERNLVTLRTISDLQPIKGADLIEVATVDGWEVVVKKGEFNVGDLAIYFEIDSFLPASNPRFSFLAQRGTKKDSDGVERVRLRTVKLKGQISQGLLLPISSFFTPEDISELFEFGFLGLDDNGNHIVLQEHRLDKFLDVIKYELPEWDQAKGMPANAGGRFPEFIPKTDAERIQNLWGKWSEKYKDVEFIASLKLDGSSITIAVIDDPEHFYTKLDKTEQVLNEETGEIETKIIEPYPFNFTREDGKPYQVIVCSRNLVLKYEKDNNFWKGVENENLITKICGIYEYFEEPLALQGELMGEGVQGNRESLKQHEVFIFRVFITSDQEFLNHSALKYFADKWGIKLVPQLGKVSPFMDYESVNDILKASEIESINNKVAEGIVYHSAYNIGDNYSDTLCFKAINNKFLIKEKD